MPETTLLETIKALCALPGASSREDAVRDYITSRVAPFADDVKTDALGNLLVFKKDAKTPAKSVMLAAHMDEVGVIAAGVTDDGYIKFSCVGGVDRRVLIGKTVLFGKNNVLGVIGNKAVHLVKKDERDKIPPLDDMYIDIGAPTKEDALRAVPLGETGVFDSAVTLLGDGLLKAKAIDDRFGCAVLVKLLESPLPVDCTFAFTVQEEVGTRGALTASYGVCPTSRSSWRARRPRTCRSAPSGKKVCAVGNGAVLPFMDSGTIYDRELFGTLTSLAEKKRRRTVADESVYLRRHRRRRRAASRAGVKKAGIAAPVRYLHSPSCVAASMTSTPSIGWQDCSWPRSVR
jgi:endoglucanase